MNNKVIIITGGSSGIGKALALQYGLLGARVVITGRNKEKLQETTVELQKAGISIVGIPCDSSLEKETRLMVEQVKEKFGQIDLLINNAGISMRSMFEDVSIDVLKTVMDINFWGTVYTTKAALPSILKQKGVIVGVSSIAGYRGLPGRSGYSASKFALNGWLESIKTELLHTGTHVMWVCPGFTSSNIRNAALNKDAKSQGESPMDEGEMMSSEECAGHIIQAIEKRKRTLVLTFTGKRAVFMNKFFPGLADKLTFNFFFKNGQLIK